MSDIIERLILRTDYADREEAADEIMRLRSEIERRINEIQDTDKKLRKVRVALEKKR